MTDLLPILLPALYGTASAVTFVVYRIDKTAAQKGRWRIPESTLHLLALIGGWPGAWLAQRMFRHKTIKKPFRFIFWITVGLNLTATAWLLASYSGLIER